MPLLPAHRRRPAAALLQHPLRYRAWGFVSKLNAKHMQLAWTTLGTLVVADFYIMAVSAGWISDLRIVG